MLLALQQELRQDQFEWAIRRRQFVDGAQLLAGVLHFRQVPVEVLAIAGFGFLRIDVDPATGFQVLEQSRFVEVEFQFLRIENLEHDQFVTASGEVTEIAFEPFQRCQQVGSQHDHTALTNRTGDVLSVDVPPSAFSIA